MAQGGDGRGRKRGSAHAEPSDWTERQASTGALLSPTSCQTFGRVKDPVSDCMARWARLVSLWRNITEF